MNNVVYHDLEQGSPDWHEIRAGRLGGTAAAALLVNGRGPGGMGAGMQSLIYKNAAALVIGDESEPVQNEWMSRGTELEPDARKAYELETFCRVEEVGYISLGDFFGYSPDGLVGDDGLIEIKCPSAAEFVRFADTLEIDPGHMAQMQWGIFLTGRKWCDYVVYHPDFHPGELVIHRVERDEKTMLAFYEKGVLYQQEIIRVLSKVAALKEDA